MNLLSRRFGEINAGPGICRKDGVMSFPLMPGYDHINVVADLDPVAAMRDSDLGDRIRMYPKLLPAGAPDFGYAVQRGTEWRIGCVGARDPEGARYSLAAGLRIEA